MQSIRKYSPTLQELGHVADDSAEHELVLVAVEPAELGDAGEESDHALHHELGELRLSPQVVEYIVPTDNNKYFNSFPLTVEGLLLF